MTAETERSNTLGLQGFLRAVRRRLGLVILCALLTPGVALGLSLASEKKYTASASLLFREPAFDQQLFGTPLFAPRDAERQAATNEKLVSLDSVADGAARRIRRGLTGAEVRSKIETEAEGQADILAVKATDTDPRFAATLANAFAREYIVLRRDADRAKVRQALRLVEESANRLTSAERGTQRGRLLRERAEQLKTIAALQTGNAELAQPARVPSSPASPKPIRNTALGALFGLLLGLGLALLLDRLDRRVRDPKEVEEVFQRPILATVPESRELVVGGPHAVDRPVPEAEAFRMLRANLRYFDVDREVRSVLLTSAAPGDGKTTVAWNLACAVAGPQSRVLLIEADLRHPSMATAIGARGTQGLSTALIGQAELMEVVQEVPVPGSQNGASLNTVDVLFAGPLPPNPTELLESDRMRDLLKVAQRDYDVVVLDTPPTSVVSDAIPLLRQVDGVIVVGRLGRSTRDSVVRLSEQLRNLEAPVLGVVVNSIRREHDAYGYGYGYGYGADDQADASADPQATRKSR
jgi:polysaccharide biosynthesis transport protein